MDLFGGFQNQPNCFYANHQHHQCFGADHYGADVISHPVPPALEVSISGFLPEQFSSRASIADQDGQMRIAPENISNRENVHTDEDFLLNDFTGDDSLNSGICATSTIIETAGGSVVTKSIINGSSFTTPPGSDGCGRGGKKRKASTTTKSGGGYKHVPHRDKPVHLVARRNARERKRVQAVNMAFMKLRKCVPVENRNKRLSKVKTLHRAIEYIGALDGLLKNLDHCQREQHHHYHHCSTPSSASNDSATMVINQFDGGGTMTAATAPVSHSPGGIERFPPAPAFKRVH